MFDSTVPTYSSETLRFDDGSILHVTVRDPDFLDLRGRLNGGPPVIEVFSASAADVIGHEMVSGHHNTMGAEWPRHVQLRTGRSLVAASAAARPLGGHDDGVGHGLA